MQRPDFDPRLIISSDVADPDSEFTSRLAAAAWSTPSARDAALLPLGRAQRGTAGTDRTAWTQAVVIGTVRRVLPLAFDAVGLGLRAIVCRKVTDLQSANEAAANAAVSHARYVAQEYAFAAKEAAMQARDACGAAAEGDDFAFAIATLHVVAAVKSAATASLASVSCSDTALCEEADATYPANSAYADAKAAVDVAVDSVLLEAVQVALDAYVACPVPKQSEPRVWILGAASTEMDAVEQLLRSAGACVVYATDSDGERVTADTAHAEGCTWVDPYPAGEDPDIITVDCSPTTLARLRIAAPGLLNQAAAELSRQGAVHW